MNFCLSENSTERLRNNDTLVATSTPSTETVVSIHFFEERSSLSQGTVIPRRGERRHKVKEHLVELERKRPKTDEDAAKHSSQPGGALTDSIWPSK